MTPLRVRLYKFSGKRLSQWKTLAFPDFSQSIWNLNKNAIIACITNADRSEDVYVQLDISTEQLIKRQLPISDFKVSCLYKP